MTAGRATAMAGQRVDDAVPGLYRSVSRLRALAASAVPAFCHGVLTLVGA